MDFAAIDYLGRPIENPTVQIDVESGERFGITYMNQEEKEVNPIILHCSPTGSVERVICSLLEKTAVEMDEKPPMLPVWLTPTQVRIIPIAERHADFALKLASDLKAQNVRVDVDEMHETVGKKIRNAGKDWVPYVVVVGDKEIEGNQLTVNVRKTGEKVSMDKDELVSRVHGETAGMPFRNLPLPVKLSKRVHF